METETKTSGLHIFYPIIIESQDSNRPWTSSDSNIFSTFAIIPSRTLPKCNLAHAVVIQSHSCVQFFATPWTAARQASLSFTISQSFLKFMSIESVMPSNHLVLCHPLLLLPSIFPSIGVFSQESNLHIRWPKNWSFSISSSNEYSALISFRIDWFDPLAVQGTVKSLLQHHSSKSAILQHSAFFMVQLS